MSTSITIQGTVIDFPTSADSPNWAPAIDSFAQSVEGALNGLAGTYDVAPQVFTITADVNSNVNIPLLSFPLANVLGATISYSYIRVSDSATEAETGNLALIYNPAAGAWQISRESVGTDSITITFSVTSLGQVQFSTTAMGGIFTTGTICYSAKAIVKS